jgi:hypothetical protein
MSTPATALSQLYHRARQDLVMRQWTGIAPDWPDRPEWLAPDFSEIEMAAITDELRRAWAIEYPAPADGVVLDDPPEGAAGWGWTCFDWDLDTLLTHIDGQLETNAATVAHRLGLLNTAEDER